MMSLPTVTCFLQCKIHSLDIREKEAKTLIRCIAGYSECNNFGEVFTAVLYRISEIVKSIFYCSDFQKSRGILEKYIICRMDPKWLPLITPDISIQADCWLKRLIEINDKGTELSGEEKNQLLSNAKAALTGLNGQFEQIVTGSVQEVSSSQEEVFRPPYLKFQTPKPQRFDAVAHFNQTLSNFESPMQKRIE